MDARTGAAEPRCLVGNMLVCLGDKQRRDLVSPQRLHPRAVPLSGYRAGAVVQFAGDGFLKQGLVAVKGYLRNGKLVRPFKRKDLLRIPGRSTEASDQALAGLARKTLEAGEIPSRGDIAAAAGVLAKDFIKNPLGFIREGNQREKLVRRVLRAAGVEVPSKPEIAIKAFKKASQKLAKYAKNNPQAVEDLIVNTGGLAGSVAGAVTAGPVGQIAGDLSGALAVRKGFTDYKALQIARQKLRADQAFKSANILQKLKMLKGQTLAELKDAKLQEAIRDNRIGDVSGWAIGNAVANSLSGVPVLGAIPFKGALAAMPSAPEVVEAARRIRQGEELTGVVESSLDRIAGVPRRAIRAGNRREARLRAKLNQNIRDRLNQSIRGYLGER